MLPTNDKPLFTPGPLTTSGSVKQAMQRDLGSRDCEFIGVVRGIREHLLQLAGVSQDEGWEAVLMQGSGTFAIESVISSVTPSDGKWLVVINGAYGERILKIMERHGLSAQAIRCEENRLPDLKEIDAALAGGQITHLAVVHCETTSGIMNPIREIGEIAKAHGAVYFVDSMSAFGGVEFDFTACHIDFLVSSANKCVQGVPGFGFALCRRATLETIEGYARTVSLDLLAQWQGLEANGQFRFTPPTHTLLAFAQALQELDEEGGVSARAARYQNNHDACVRGMRAIGFSEYVPADLQGHIITSFLYPTEDFDFEAFYNRLNEKGFVIYPGKVTRADCFRVGHIGDLAVEDTMHLLTAVEEVMKEMSAASVESDS
ncbi:MAG: 2-aminoethylphosphonate--pyruvate transaminase [Planctomycetota bacterium]|nr:2-aminoethylphosphonate--pyruvate transaminase [Planctomycetota bacterium]